MKRNGDERDRTVTRQRGPGSRKWLHDSRPSAAAGACRGGKTPAAIVASGKTMMPDSLGLADVQTGVVIGLDPYTTPGVKKDATQDEIQGLSPPGKKAAPGPQSRQQGC